MPPCPDWNVVYTIVGCGAKRHWLRIGMAFVNRDGSLNVRLDAVPLTGQLRIRDDAPSAGRSDEVAASEAAPDHRTES